MKKTMIVLLTCCVMSVPALNTSLGVKSAILPGMGQLSAGGGSITSKNTLKGLGLLAGFTVCINGMISNISQRESYAEQTQVYADQYAALQVSGNYADANSVYLSWNAANDSYNSANIAVFVYLGLSVAFYGYGIFDALMFTREDTPQGQEGGATSLRLPRNMGVQCVRNHGRSDVVIKYNF